MFKNLLFLTFLIILISGFTFSQDTLTQTEKKLKDMTPDKALQMLKDGNERFINGNRLDRVYSKQVKETASNQYPFAVILSCIDSRAPGEIIFDQGIGDIFNVRIAGNVTNDDILGSLEFACKVTGSKLILVLGHTNCGAIKGAIDDVKLGNLSGLLTKIKPAVAAIDYDGDRTSKNYDFIDAVSKQNVFNTMKMIHEQSSILNDMIKSGDVKLEGGMYDLKTGKVEFYDDK